MRLHVGLPKMFWAEAVNTAGHLINRGSSTPLKFKLPEEVWSGKKVNLYYLKVFGCVSYVHVDHTAKTKLDAKTKKCFFIGYGGSELDYCFWDDQNWKIIRSKDVIFNEDVLYKDRGIGSEAKKPEVIPLKDLPEVKGENLVTEDQENIALEENQTTSAFALRRSSRTIRPPHRYSPALHYILLIDRGEPESYDEVLQDKELVKWELAMKDEIDSLMSNQMWPLVELPKGKKALHNKWVYRIKEECDGNKRYKARLVVKGF